MGADRSTLRSSTSLQASEKGFLKKKNDFLQCPRVLKTGELVTVRLERYHINSITFHLELCHERGPPIFCVQVYDNKLLSQFRELPVRSQVPFKNPAIAASEGVKQVDKDGFVLLPGTLQRLRQIRYDFASCIPTGE
jgi:hypothetical protein